MDKQYTTKTSSLKATTADIYKVESKVIDSKEIKLDGVDILDLIDNEVSQVPVGFQDPEDFKKLVKRCELPEGSNYILWTDTGQIAYMSFADRLIDGSYMFSNAALTSWNIDLPSLTNGMGMFESTPLTSFNGDLSRLTNGGGMFIGTRLTSWNIDLPSLTSGASMFTGTRLTSWNIDLPSLTNGMGMFSGTRLTSWNIDLPSLTSGQAMFVFTPLTSFSGDLSSLTNGNLMFLGCKLNLESVQNIASTINTVSSGSISLGVQSSLQGNTELEAAINTITSKGWKVMTQYNA